MSCMFIIKTIFLEQKFYNVTSFICNHIINEIYFFAIWFIRYKNQVFERNAIAWYILVNFLGSQMACDGLPLDNKYAVLNNENESVYGGLQIKPVSLLLSLSLLLFYFISSITLFHLPLFIKECRFTDAMRRLSVCRLSHLFLDFLIVEQRWNLSRLLLNTIAFSTNSSVSKGQRSPI